jgi:hypothetical protein
MRPYGLRLQTYSSSSWIHIGLENAVAHARPVRCRGQHPGDSEGRLGDRAEVGHGEAADFGGGFVGRERQHQWY